MSCKIHLDNPGIFGPGDFVTGKVICIFEEKENIRGIRSKLRGKENTFWSEKRGRTQVRYTGEHTFLTGDVCLFGEGRINAGTYEYPFSFSLPARNICSSYQHRFGSIRYYISANVDKPFSFDYKDEITLHVAIPINFNEIPRQIQLLPITYQTEKQTGSCLCVSGFITLSMTLEKDSFILGEIVKVRVDVDNKSNVDVEGIKVQLASNVHFTTQRPSARQKIDKSLLAVAHGEAIEARSQKTLIFDLLVPQTAIIPNLNGCSLFKQWSSIGVEAVLPAFHSNLPLEANVHLGHIFIDSNIDFPGMPIRQTFGDIYPPANANPVGHPHVSVPSAPNMLTDNDRPTAPFGIGENANGPASPPPTYDEAVTMDLSKPLPPKARF